jgi:hypothetical protein
MSDQQTALPLPPRRTPGLEDSVLATIRKHPRGITPARLAEIFSGRAVSSQCSRLVAKGLIERRAGNLFPVAAPVAAPEPRRAALDEAAPLVRRSDAGIIVGNPEPAPALFSPAPVDPPAIEAAPVVRQEHPLRQWFEANRISLSPACKAELEEVLERVESDAEELAKIEDTKLDLHKAASDLRTLRALFEDVTGPDLVSKAAHALSAVEALEAREEVIREAERVLREVHMIKSHLGELRFIDPRGGEMPTYIVERVELTDKGGQALLSFAGSKAPGWIGQEIGGAVVVFGVFK